MHVKKPAEDPGDKVVYLTFDDGPGAYTQQLLDVLDKYNVKATFFVTNASPKYQDMIAKEYAAGHSIGIHTYSHDYNKIYASEEAYFEDLEAMQDVIVKQTGETTNIIRFPGGSSNTVSDITPGLMTTLTQEVQNRGYQYFDWNVASGDAGETTDTETVVSNVISGIKQHNKYPSCFSTISSPLVWTPWRRSFSGGWKTATASCPSTTTVPPPIITSITDGGMPMKSKTSYRLYLNDGWMFSPVYSEEMCHLPMTGKEGTAVRTAPYRCGNTLSLF